MVARRREACGAVVKHRAGLRSEASLKDDSATEHMPLGEVVDN